MFEAINFDNIAEEVKNIYDNSRCSTCDKHDGIRMRYRCGHTSCDACVDISESCVLCLTPPETTSCKPAIDNPFTERSNNARKLVNILRDKFNLDVNKRQRISDHLKIEKEIFPQCIQAPAKYYNKRKTLRLSTNNKENYRTSFPGEEVSIHQEINSNMENSNEHVQKWLNKYIRKPFSELNPNDQRLGKPPSIKKQNILDSPLTKTINRKRPHQSTKNKRLNILVKKTKVIEKLEVVENSQGDTNASNIQNKINVNDESGIGLDDEAVIVIDDSLPKVDKDYNAWLAVLEAENHKSMFDTFTTNEHSKLETNEDSELKTIPFYKKGCIYEVCKVCNACDVDVKCDHWPKKPKDVVITVENKSFKTVIKVGQVENYTKSGNKQSVEIQTDEDKSIYKYSKINDDSGIEQVDNKNGDDKSLSMSEDLFVDDGQIIEQINHNKNNNLDKKHNVIIEESDSDEDLEHSLSLEVTADVHRSCDQIDYGILTEVGDLNEHIKRPRRAARGLTPTSTDSSDKENYNPNRMKTKITSKKKYKK